MQSLLTVLINPIEGREADFNDWYTNVHIRDVMRFPGSIRVQQLIASTVQLTPPSHKYFTLYDTFDPALLSQAHKDAAGTRRMVVGNAHDKPNVINGYYYGVASATNQPTMLTPDCQPLILEQIDVPENERTRFEEWYISSRLTMLLKAPSHISGTFMRFDPAGQMREFVPAYSHIALWRVQDLAIALSSWSDTASSESFAGLTRRVSCFEVMAPYLTRDHVLEASAQMQQLEEAARQRAEKALSITQSPGIHP